MTAPTGVCYDDAGASTVDVTAARIPLRIEEKKAN